MSILTGSLDSPSFGGSTGHTGLSADTPSEETLQTMHADGVRLARGRMMMALAVIVPVVALVVAGDAQLAFSALMWCLAVIGWVVDATYEWWRIRRQDPLTYWKLDQQEEAENYAAASEHQIRLAGVTPMVTFGLLGIVTAVTAVQFLAVGVRESIPLAALVKPAVYAGEAWRLLSAAFLHANTYHLVSNLGALLTLGALIEAYDRRSRIPLTFLAGALCGSIASTLFVTASSFGASAGILGLAGYLVVSGAGPTSGPSWLKRQLYKALAMTAVIGVIGFFFIDNAAHVGGTLGGVAVGLIAKRVRDRGLDAWSQRLDMCGWISAGIVIAGGVFTGGRLLQVW